MRDSLRHVVLVRDDFAFWHASGHPAGWNGRITARSDQSAQSHRPGALIAFLKIAVLWPIQSCAFFSLRNRSIISREPWAMSPFWFQSW
jgi:hypothetical protein